MKYSPLHEKILKQEAPGGSPALLSLVVPSITRPGQPFELKLAILDSMGYPSLEYEGSVEVTPPGGGGSQSLLRFETGEPAIGQVSGIRLREEGVFRFEGKAGDIEAYSNPTLCSEEKLPGIYWGDPHVHTVLSNCHPDKCRSLNFCYTSARFLTGLDWVAAADHVSNGRCDWSKWKEQRTVSELHHDEPDFVTLPGYEASLKGGAGGDNNVYMVRFPENFVDEYEEGTVKTLCEELKQLLNPEEFFVVPHHTTRTGKHGEITDDIYPGPDAMPLIEIHSKWGTSEYRGNSNPLQKIHSGPSYAVDFLNRGMILGFVAGTDTHATMPSGAGEEPGHIDRPPGITAVRADKLTRRNIFENLQARNCYATSLERILLHGMIDGVQFGEQISAGDLSPEPEIDVLVAAKSSIRSVELVRNGETIETLNPDTWNAHFACTDTDKQNRFMELPGGSRKQAYYYLRVTCESGAQAWSSPVWVTEEESKLREDNGEKSQYRFHSR
ncbi:MAG: hypothetical protein KGZ25_04860 [Planctomycetes bacterium]|nr:hypothetical protein [Planctomycetota bacterium]